MNNLTILEQYMARYKLTRQQVAEITGYSIHTVYGWTRKGKWRTSVSRHAIKHLIAEYGEL